MLEQQVRPSDVLDLHVLAALNDIKRIEFVDESFAGLAYADTELSIGFGQTMLSPVVEGRLLQVLDLQPNEEVLEIGTGSGYFTALLANLGKHVRTVELIPELSELAQQRIKQMGVDNVTFEMGDASHGWPLADRIEVIISTAAFVSVPESYKNNLKVGGRMVAVVGEAPFMTIQIIKRVTEWEWQTDVVYETVIPAMINAEPTPEFEF
ncbi:MAG: protein-L-isoaspartate O-methyltransferase [Methylophaga sp.]|nr:MAG: protein-L-isoaspartate O-methyltransferase [Methylophaga sp.]